MATKLKAQKAEGGGAVADLPQPAGTFDMLRLSDLFPSPTNPRKTFPIEQLTELAASIKANGVINPITVRKINAGYEVVSGGRRYRAAVMAGLLEMPCIVRELSDAQVLDIQIEENLHRSDVPPLEEAIAFDDLLRSKKLTISELAGRLNKSESYVLRRLKLNELHEVYRPYLESGILATTTAEVIASYPSDTQKSLFKKVYMEYGGASRFMDTHSVREKFRWEACSDLSKAMWPLDRADLQPGLQSCSACPKNTAVASLLFPDATDGARCTDKACWKVKESVWKAIALKEWEEYCAANGNEPAYFDLNYYNDNDKKTVEKLLGREITPMPWREFDMVEEGTPGAIEVMMVGASSWHNQEKNFTRGWIVPTQRQKVQQENRDWQMQEIDEMEIPEEEKAVLREQLTEKRRLAKILAEQRKFDQAFKLGLIQACFPKFDEGASPQLLLKLIRLSVRHQFTGHNTRRVWLDYFGEEAKTWQPESFAVKVNGDGMEGEKNPKWTKGVEKAWQQVLNREKRKGEYERMDERAWGDWISQDERIEFLDSILLHCDEMRIVSLFSSMQLQRIAESVSGWGSEAFSIRFFTDMTDAAGIDADEVKAKIQVEPDDEEEGEFDYEEEDDFDNEFALEEEGEEE